MTEEHTTNEPLELTVVNVLAPTPTPTPTEPTPEPTEPTDPESTEPTDPEPTPSVPDTGLEGETDSSEKPSKPSKPGGTDSELGEPPLTGDMIPTWVFRLIFVLAVAFAVGGLGFWIYDKRFDKRNK